MAKLISVKACSSIEGAEAAKKLLDSAGVLCTVSASDSDSEPQETADAQEVIHILVSEHEAAQALRILGECSASDIYMGKRLRLRLFKHLHLFEKIMVSLLLGGIGWFVVWCFKFNTLISTSKEYVLDIYWYLAIVFLIAFFVSAIISRRSLGKKSSFQQVIVFLWRWWGKYKLPTIISAAVIIIILLVFILIRWRSNEALVKEIRAEFDVWLSTLSKVPDDENGMLVITKGLKAFNDLPPQPMTWGEFILENEAHRKALLDYLEQKEQALEKVREGLKYKKFQFPADYSKGTASELPNLLGFKFAAQAFAWKGELAELENRKSDALKEYFNALRLAKTLSEEPLVIYRMMEIAASHIGIRPITKMLSAGSVLEDDLADALKTLIELHGKSGDFYNMMEATHYWGWHFIADIIEQKADFGQFSDCYPYNVLSSIWFSKYIYNYRYDIDKFRKALEICHGIDPANYWRLPPEAKEEDAFMKKIALSPRELSLAALFIESPPQCVDAFIEIDILWRGAIALAAVRLFEVRNGRLPKNLSELSGLVPMERLVDPFSGKDIIYRLVDDDFYLYSTGYDGVDGKPTKDNPFYEDEYEVNWRSRTGVDIIFHAPLK